LSFRAESRAGRLRFRWSRHTLTLARAAASALDAYDVILRVEVLAEPRRILPWLGKSPAFFAAALVITWCEWAHTHARFAVATIPELALLLDDIR
jgi:hypothetical protein